jgi:2-polyprenyl-3-methyl-5-hydroxy-6-metoxy-1,4-benzoquinol methylase
MKCPLCNHLAKCEQCIEVASITSLWRGLGVDVERFFPNELIAIFKCSNCKLCFYSPPCPGDNKFYGDLASWDWYYKHSGKSEYEFAASLIPPGTSMLDVGCGIGEFSTHLLPGVNFLGAELSTKSVEIAHSLGRDVRQIDITNPPSNFVGHFDCITCFQVLEHIVDIQGFFLSLVALCKPGGIIVVAVPNNDGFIGDAVNNIFNMPPHHVLLWNMASLYFLAQKFNLAVLDYVEENLADAHRQWGFSIAVNKIFNKIFRIKPKAIDLTFIGRATYKISTYLARPISNIAPDLITTGHSSIIVLRKPDNG